MPYFDHAATSPMPAEVIDAWVAANQYVGNGSSTHRDGQRARLSFEEAREAIGAALGAKAFDTTITGSGTEAINLAIKGIFCVSKRSAVFSTRNVMRGRFRRE